MEALVTIVKLGSVFALLALTLRWLRRHDLKAGASARHSERPVAVVGQAKLSKGASVALVRVGTEHYAVGVTERAVTLLTADAVDLPGVAKAVDDAEAAEATDVPAPRRPSFGEALVAAVREGMPGGRRLNRTKVEYLELPATLPAALPLQIAADGPAASSAGMPAPLVRS